MTGYYQTLDNIFYTIIEIMSSACILIFLVCIYKKITGDDHEKLIYGKRLKNSLIALVIVLSIGTIHGLVKQYFGNGSIMDTFETTQNTSTLISNPTPVMSNGNGSGGGASSGGGESAGGGGSGR